MSYRVGSIRVLIPGTVGNRNFGSIADVITSSGHSLGGNEHEFKGLPSFTGDFAYVRSLPQGDAVETDLRTRGALVYG